MIIQQKISSDNYYICSLYKKGIIFKLFFRNPHEILFC